MSGSCYCHVQRIGIHVQPRLRVHGPSAHITVRLGDEGEDSRQQCGCTSARRKFSLDQPWSSLIYNRKKRARDALGGDRLARRKASVLLRLMASASASASGTAARRQLMTLMAAFALVL
ncbi:hypothetical protein BAUCODRAFT_119954 [Baudoinia panamericana UAMH 10762]|uniref:Uncharacterized protein n=1 Tax=Baudoinia panamericana (strain UAMH 10762) TaxID=717646 RepID=M2MPH3_BAUPA|nr:uncharacterized protein BAUCODRAFT_119954 [Baudoinia panamericana UAMH 10762]EMC98641.1 hypothetical protein BAUCODRAFT_119954 [Baudoinia panamericana UAMH 10762]